MKVSDLDAAAEQATDLLKALANPVRLKLLCHLVEGERSVGELAERLDIRDTNVSQHLALLRKDRMVRTRREGQTIYYTIDNPAALAVLQVLHGLYCPPR